MKTAYVVIGAGFGDEGKGLITDYLTRRSGGRAVARFNGGAQAGHTVQLPNGVRHVFGHYASGTLANANTILSNKFIVNPFLLKKEHDALAKITKGRTQVAAMAGARVTTFYDMVLNQLKERARGNDRHGSCGCGINETVTRHEELPLRVGDQVSEFYAVHKAMAVKLHNYVEANNLDWQALVRENGSLELDPITHAWSAYSTIQDLIVKVSDRPAHHLVPSVFEGAQGLMLDEHLGAFPHVTRSMTGLPQAVAAAMDMGVDHLIPVYVTRAYSTRHGAGLFKYEDQPISDGFVFVDPTNVDNEWQGSIRKAPLRLGQLQHFIGSDLVRGERIAEACGVTLGKAQLAVTCLDQLGPNVNVIDMFGEVLDIKTETLHNVIATVCALEPFLLSYGPTNQDVRVAPRV
jgi:adenylosuccinate synthase